MKTKFLSFFLLGLLCSIGSVWGDTEIFSVTVKSSSDKSVSQSTSGTVISSDDIIISGGTMSVINNNSSAKTYIKASIGPSGDKRNCFRIDTNDVLFKIDLSDALQAGDVISTIFYNNNVELWIATSKTRPSSAPTTKLSKGTTTSSIWHESTSYTVEENDGICGQSTIYLHRNSNTTQFVDFKINRSAPASAPETPSFSPASGGINGNSNVTITSTNATTIYYKWMETNTDPDSWESATATSGAITIQAPNVTATRYLYAYGYNTTGTSSTSSTSFSITKVKLAAGLAYATSAVDKTIGDANFTNTLSNPNSLTVTYSISNNGTGSTINASTGEVTLGENAGEETITASSASTDDYLAGEATYTLTLSEGLTAVSEKFWKVGTTGWRTDNLELIGTFGEDRDVARNVDGIDFSKESKINAGTGNAVHFRIAGQTLVTIYGRTNNDKSTTTANIYVGSIADGNKVSTASWGDNTSAGKVTYFNTGNSEKDIYMCGITKQWDLMGIRVQPLTHSLTINGTYGWASMYLDYPAEVPSGVTAYYASSDNISGNTVTLTAIEAGATIPAKTGVIVKKGNADTYNFAYSSATPVSVSNNILTGTTTAISTPSGAYVLSGATTPANCVFAPFSGETLAAYKAYIAAGSVLTSAPSIRFVIAEENNATALEDTKLDKETIKFVENGELLIKKNGVVYDVMGRAIR